MKKIIIYNEIDWSFLDQRHHHLARFYADLGFEVEFVERVVARIPSFGYLLKLCLRKLLPQQKLKHQRVAKVIPKGVTVRRSAFLPYTYRIFALYNYVIWFMVERKKQRGALLYSFVDNPYLIGGIFHSKSTAAQSVFDIIHNWWDFPWRTEQHRSLVQQCLQNFDVIVTDSPVIQDRLTQQNVQAHLMLPGVAKCWFEHPVKADEKSVKAVFFGNLRGNSDITLINLVASTVGIDIYGIIDPEIEENLVNYTFKGSVLSEELPLLLQAYNVIILPYSEHEFSLSISPAKYFESLATGALVMTRADFSHLPGFNEFCLHVTSVDGVDQQLLSALSNQSHQTAQQSQFVHTQTWDNRFTALVQHLKEAHDA